MLRLVLVALSDCCVRSSSCCSFNCICNTSECCIINCWRGVVKLSVCIATTLHTFNDPLSGTTRVSQYQKGKTNLDFTEARDSEWQWHQLCHMQVCISLQTDNHASTSPLSFIQAGCPSCRPTNSIKAVWFTDAGLKSVHMHTAILMAIFNENLGPNLQNILQFIVRSTYDGDLKRAKNLF